MRESEMKTRRSEKGFTLVELAIVMIIIGLLIGGILKGQELIANAQVTATVAQLKGIDAAASTFRDMYDATPGDMLNPDTRIPNCAGNCDTDGDGNGRVDTMGLGIAPGALDDENTVFWLQLAAADLLNGIDSDFQGQATLNWGSALPASEIAGGMTIAFEAGGGGAGAVVNSNLRGGHYLALTADPALDTDDADSQALTAGQAARIDRKMDDGIANAGSVVGAEDAADDCALDTGIYEEADDAVMCSIFVRVQN